MLRKRGIQSQLILIILVALIVLVATLQVVQAIGQREALIAAKRGQSQALAASIEETIKSTDYLISLIERLQLPPDIAQPVTETRYMQMIRLIFLRLPNHSSDVDFAVLVRDGAIEFHTESDNEGLPLDALNLADLPLDKTVRRTVPVYGEVYLTYEKLAVADPERWFIVGIRAEAIDSSLWENIRSSSEASLVVMGLIALAVLVVLRFRITRPLREVSTGAQAFTEGDLSYRIEPRGSREMRDLASTLNHMAVSLEESRVELENSAFRVQERSRDLEMAAEIGHVVTSLHDMNVLMRETVNQIRRRFDVIYHAQIFLIDDLGDYAVLVESTGEAGKMLLSLGHKLMIGSDSVIGRVTSRGQAVIASDTYRGDVPWRPNPLLPDTRAEMALPLLFEGRVIGALDVQSTQPDVFTQDMVQTFEVLAAQLAIAIQNARLLADSVDRVQEIDNLNRQLTRTVWREFAETTSDSTPLGYMYNQMKVLPLDDQTRGQLLLNRVEANIQVRGESIGTLMAALPEGEELAEDDRALVEAVAERVALAVENARLFQQTQRALAETERLYETARAVSSASELQSIYEMVVEQLSTAPYVDDILILLSGPDPALVQYLETVYAWNRSDLLSKLSTQERLQVLPLTYSDEDVLAVEAPMTYSNITREMSRTHPLHTKLTGLNTSSAVLAPLHAGGRWFGMLVCASRMPDAFEAGYSTFVSALADQLAIAIENRRLFEEAQTEARRARALAEAGQLASQIGGNFEEGLQNLFEAVAGPGHYDRWWFGLLSSDKTLLECVVASDHALPEIIYVEHASNALAETARIGEIVLVNDPTDHPALDVQDPAQIKLLGKHIATPVKIGPNLIGVMQIGRGLDEQNLDERDIQLAATLASQVAVATQNRRLFERAESERKNLQVIVDAMPVGVLVTNRDGSVVLSNQQLLDLLGPNMKPGGSSAPESYPLVHTSTQGPYPRSSWPLNRVFETGESIAADNISVLHPSGQEINLLVSAAPIYDEHGVVASVVGAFQDITELHELESALQDSLRETTMLYEASRSISQAEGMKEVLDVTLLQLGMLLPSQAHIFFREETSENEPPIKLAASRSPSTAIEYDTRQLDLLFKGEPVMFHATDAPDPVAGYMRQTDLASLMSFPLNVHGKASGWVMIGFATPHEFTSEERRLLGTLADQAAISIENQRLLVRTERALQDTATLYLASRSIAAAATLNDILLAFVNNAAPPPAHQAALYVLLSDNPDPAYAAIEVAANWSASQSGDLSGMRYNAEQFPFWNEIISTDILCIDDVNRSEAIGQQAVRIFNTLDIQAAALIPLRLSGRPLGLVMVGLSETWKHGESEFRAYQALADQAAVSLENNRLLRQIQRRARQLATSAEISRAVTSILQLDILFPQVVNMIRDSFNYDHVQIFIVSQDGAQANLVASTGEAGQRLLAIRHSLPVGSQSVIGQVTLRSQPQIALDTADARVVHKFNPYLPNTRSEMALPLLARGQVLGALDVQSNQPGAFTEEDASVLSSLADMVATAIANAQLFELSERRAEEMGFLFNVTTAATTSPDLRDALQNVVETVRTAMNIPNVSIFLPDDSGQYMMRSACTTGSSNGVEREISLVSVDRGLIGWVARHGEAVIIGDISKDPRRLPADNSTQSVLAVPLKTASNLAGVLVVENEQTYAFTQNDMRLLQTMSGSVAAVIQNSRLLQEVQEANERLLEMDRLKTNFLAAMSHELRTPLNSIIGFSRVILKGIDGPLTEMQEQDLSTIYDSGKHLLGLVNDILDQAKIEAGKMELTFGYFKVQDVVHGVMSTAIGLTRDRPVQLFTEIEENLPDAYGDEFRSRQILLNLVSNACKFTPEGRITVNARVVNEDDRQFIEVSVTDTGIGIAEKDMPLLFEAFQQVDNSTTRSVEGTGMGLPLARSLVELQGGQIRVVSEVGVGSTFSVTIPTLPAPVEESDSSDQGDGLTEQIAELVEQSAMPIPQNQIVLVIEDNEEVISLYRRYLAHEGYEVLGSTHPQDAHDLIVAYGPCAVLLDVNMPMMDGWEVLARLKEDDDTVDTPVIVCSINTDTERGYRLGASDYLVKPFTEEQLLNSLREVLAETNRQRILIVDDKPESVRIFRDALAGQYRVLEATNGQDALDLIRRLRRLDLLILDLRMPDLDGFELVQALRSDERTSQIPILVLTAEEVSAAERNSLEAIDVYRKDDLDEEGLLRRVEAQLGSNGEND